METLDEEEEAKHEEERHIKLVAEDGEREEGLCDEHPRLIIEALENMNGLSGPRRARRAAGDAPQPHGAEEYQRRSSVGHVRREGSRGNQSWRGSRERGEWR